VAATWQHGNFCRYKLCKSCISGIEMRRQNPDTGDRFHRGDTRPDGYVFFAYTNKVQCDGYFKEIWLSPSASARATVGDRERKRRVRGAAINHAGSDI